MSIIQINDQELIEIVAAGPTMIEVTLDGDVTVYRLTEAVTILTVL